MKTENYDTRDLEEELNNLIEAQEDGEEIDEDRLKELQDLKAELESYGWEYGIYLIEEDNFEDYATELFDECYAHDIPDNLKNYINYEAFADDLKQDYSMIEFEGNDYYWMEA